MPKFAKMFIVATLLVLFGTCMFFCLAPQNVQKLTYVEAEESIEYSTSEPILNDFLYADYAGLNDYIETTKANRTHRLFTGKQLIIDTIWVNFKDFSAFTENSFFIFTNKLDDISEFFWEDSCHNLSVKFNVYLYHSEESCADFNNKPSYFSDQNDFFFKAKSEATEMFYHGEANARMIMLSQNTSTKTSGTAWPHVWMTIGDDASPLCVIASNRDTLDFCHEIYHILGLADLYTPTSRLNNIVDIMQGNTSKNATTTAQNKLELGWINESDFNDDRVSGIENIYLNGTYTLQQPKSAFGTIAYKFGVSRSEFFLVEQRIINDSQYIIVQKINTDYFGNTYAKTEAEYFSVMFANKEGIYFLTTGDYAGSEANAFTYADGSRANYFINNIQYDSFYKTISFDFYTGFQESLEDPIKALTQPEINHNYYINVVDKFGYDMEVTEIFLFNSQTNSYEKVPAVSKVYINNLPFYALFDVQNKYTKCKIVYTSFCTSVEKEIQFLTYNSHYFVQLEMNFIQMTGVSFVNFRDLMIDSILSFFGVK